MPELALHVQDIDESGKDYAFELKPTWLDATLAEANLRADPSHAAGVIKVHAQQNGNEYLVTGRIVVQLLAECCRCLGPTKLPVEVDFAALYSRDSKSTHRPLPELYELTDEDCQREHFTGHDIVLDELVREHLVLELPMQPMCSENCSGIAVPEHVRPPPDTFSEPGTVDPRLAPLSRLRDKVPPQTEPTEPVRDVVLQKPQREAAVPKKDAIKSRRNPGAT